jgi:hypothetical protein
MRLMVTLHYLKYTHNLSDEDFVSGWVENPYHGKFSDFSRTHLDILPAIH